MGKRGPQPLPPGEGYRATRKNVSLDAETLDALAALVDALEPRFGFRPTLAQAVKFACKAALKDAD